MLSRPGFRVSLPQTLKVVRKSVMVETTITVFTKSEFRVGLGFNPKPCFLFGRAAAAYLGTASLTTTDISFV